MSIIKRAKLICEGQWTYRGCLIERQIHPKLLKYGIYDGKDFAIGSANSISGAMREIDQFIN